MLSFAAKFRPKQFDEIVGQNIIKKAVINGLTQERLSHICLFSGPAGTGKTTLMRLIALWLVCEQKDTNNNVCLKCSNCLSALNDSHPDIMEFDAATHTGVDSLKDAMENAIYKPQLSKYKIFLIDEIHMLSRSAISSMLKIIEEPADHIWFLFATTELDKIPETIISRCLTMQLTGIPESEMLNHLKNICTKEQLSFEEDALEIIVIHANGCARLALSLLEQTSLLSNEKSITLLNAQQICKVADKESIQALYSAIKNNNIDSIFNICAQIVHKYTPNSICFQLIEQAKNDNHINLAVQFAQILNDIYKSPCPNKILAVYLSKAAFLYTLPSAHDLWQAIKQTDVANDNISGNNQVEIVTNSDQTSKTNQTLLDKAKILFEKN